MNQVGSTRYFWVRGGNYTRPFIVLAGVSRKLVNGAVQSDVWFNFPNYPERSTAKDFGASFLSQFEWMQIKNPAE